MELSEKQNQILTNSSFDEEQINQIRAGFIISGLSEEQVKTYADPKFNSKQMNEIRRGLESHIPEEIIKLYADPAFTDKQMKVIESAAHECLDINEIKIFACPEFSCEQMLYLKDLLQTEITAEQVAFVANPEFTKDQMQAVVEGFDYYKLTVDQVAPYIKPAFDCKQINQLTEAIWKDFTEEQIRYIANLKFSSLLMYQIRRSFDAKFSIDEIKQFINDQFTIQQSEILLDGLLITKSLDTVLLYANPAYNEDQMKQINMGFLTGLSKEQVQMYMNPKFSDEQMEEIKKGFKSALSVEQVSVYAKPEFTAEQMNEIRLCYIAGLTKEEIQICADSELAPWQINYMRSGFEEDFTNEQVLLLRGEYSPGQCREILAGIEHGLTIEQVKQYADPDSNCVFMSMKREMLEFGVVNIQDYKFITDKYPNANKERSKELSNALSMGLNEKQIEMIIDKNIPTEQIAFIADTITKSKIENLQKGASIRADARHKTNEGTRSFI